MESFKDAENQELPAAERLEEISKAEMALWIDEVETRALALEEARQEYQVLLIWFSCIRVCAVLTLGTAYCLGIARGFVH